MKTSPSVLVPFEMLSSSISNQSMQTNIISQLCNMLFLEQVYHQKATSGALTVVRLLKKAQADKIVLLEERRSQQTINQSSADLQVWMQRCLFFLSPRLGYSVCLVLCKQSAFQTRSGVGEFRWVSQSNARPIYSNGSSEMLNNANFQRNIVWKSRRSVLCWNSTKPSTWVQAKICWGVPWNCKFPAAVRLRLAGWEISECWWATNPRAATGWTHHRLLLQVLESAFI